MRKRIGFFLLLMLSVVMIIGCSSKSNNEDDSYRINDVIIRAFVLPNGNLDVHEFYTYQFATAVHGTTRSIGSKGHQGITDFQAFAIPKGESIATVTEHPNLLQPLSVQHESDDNLTTYQIIHPSGNETQSFYYHYELQQVIHKYSDISDLYWSFFDQNNNSNLHHVEISMTLPQKVSASDIHIYLKDMYGGRLFFDQQQTVYYKNKELPAHALSEIRVLFPPQFMSEMQTQSLAMKNTLVSAEDTLASKYQLRTPRLEKLRYVISGVMILLALAIITSIILRVIGSQRARRAQYTTRELENTDPLLLVYLSHPKQIVPEDLMAALFSLYRKDVITIETVPIRIHYRNDITAPDYTLRFAIKDVISIPLQKDERYLLEWLFTDMQRGFTLDILAGPTSQEKHDPARMEYYGVQYNTFYRHYRKWSKQVKRRLDWNPYYQTPLLLYPVCIMLTLLHSGLLAYLYMIDILSANKIIIGWVSLVIFTGVAILYRRSKLLFTLYILLFMLILFWGATASEVQTLLLWCSGLLLVFRYVLPYKVWTAQGLPYRYGIKLFRDRLRTGGYVSESNPQQLEKLLQYSIIFKEDSAFLATHPQVTGYHHLIQLAPLLALAEINVSTIQFTYRTMRQSNYTPSDSTTNYVNSPPHSQSDSNNSSSSDHQSGGGGGAGTF